MKRYSSTVKPMLTSKHKIDRVKFALKYINNDGNFDSIYDMCYLDKNIST